MAVDYKHVEFELFGLLLKTKELLVSLTPEDELAQRLDEGLLRIKTKKYNVAVVGEFRRGKSSIINALLGLSVLPADATPTTATVNRITFGTEPAATVYFKDGSCRQLADIKELPDYVTKISEEREAVAKTVREAVVQYPIVICQNHVDIIDTPGLSDDEEMTRVTIGLLQNIDAAIVAVSALAPFAETEKRFVAELIANRGVTHVLFVVTFIDQIDEDEYDRVFAGIRERIKTMTLDEVEARYGDDTSICEKAHRILDDPSVFGVSAKKALKAFEANNRKMLAESRFVFFKESLYTLLTARQSINMAEKSVFLIKDAAAAAQKLHSATAEALSSRLEKLDALPTIVEAYRQSAIHRMDALLVKYAARVREIISQDASRIEQLLPFFIKKLSSVYELNNILIRQAIMEGAENAAEMIKDNNDKTASNLLSLFNELTDEYAVERHQVIDAAENCGASGADKTSAIHAGRFLQDVRVPEFNWTGTLVPLVANFAGVNVIGHVRLVVENTLVKVEQDWSNYVRNLRASSFKFARQDAKKITALSEAAIAEAETVRDAIVEHNENGKKTLEELNKMIEKGNHILEEVYDASGKE
jgi:GTPase Era involved in 16S rRNA processing